MGEDRIRYLKFINGRWRWCPCKKAMGLGFTLVNLSGGAVLDGVNIPSVEDKARAVALNDAWDMARRGEPVSTMELSKRRIYPSGSVGHCYNRALAIREKSRADAGKAPMSKEQKSRDDWPRAWKWLEPVFGDIDPRTITPEDLQALRGVVARTVSESEAFRTIKVWRALWKKMAAMGCCDRDNDPSLVFANSAPRPRQEIWSHHDVLRIVQRAWRERYYGLAAIVAVAWDTMLSPIDARSITAGQRARDSHGAVFFLDRAKTGRAAAGTLSRWSEAIVDAYLKKLAIELHDKTPLFWSRGHESGAGGRPWTPRPYKKDRLSRDFARIRTLIFGGNDERQLADMRRSGSVEMVAGEAAPGVISAKMANTLSVSNRLHKTYNPVDVAAVRVGDAAREVGRGRIKQERKP
jgi:hypothetical protein